MPSPETATPRATPLLELQRELGAEVGERMGVRVAVGFGPVPEEVEVLRAGCGLVDRSWIDVLELTGPDRERFFNGLVTCEVRGLGDGGGAYGFITARKGGVVADFALLSLADRFRLELPTGRGEAVAEHLESYLLADRVELRPDPAAVPLAVAGPGAKAALRALLDEPPGTALDARWGHAEVRLAGRAVRLAHRPLLGVEAWTLWVEPGQAREVAEALLAGEAVRPVGFDALDTVRIEAGVPWWGRDYDDSNLPQETGLEEALNFTKGCYLGQEVVARVHYRGGVNRLLRGLQFDGDEPPAEGTELSLERRAVGRVGSVALSPTLEGPVGLALVHKRGAEPGTRLELEGGGEAEVAELPLVG